MTFYVKQYDYELDTWVHKSKAGNTRNLYRNHIHLPTRNFLISLYRHRSRIDTGIPRLRDRV